MERPFIDFVIIGAQKSATTSLQRALQRRPDIYLPRQETRLFEDPWFSADQVRKFATKSRARQRKFLFGIKRPDYLGHSGVCAQRLHEYLPNTKLLVVLRDPVERAISAYFHYMRYDCIPLMQVEDGMRLLLKGGFPGYPISRNVLEYGLYAKHLATYFEFYGPDSCLICFHDNILCQESKEFFRVAKFLQLDDPANLCTNGRRSQAVVYSMPRLRFLRLRSPLVFRWTHQRTAQDFRFPILSKGIWYAFESIDRALLRRWFGNARPRLSKSLRTELIEYYQDDVVRLRKLVPGVPDGWLAFEVD